jgi:uncharacterized membrane protein YphA (DoxX/SURF4 family)
MVQAAFTLVLSVGLGTVFLRSSLPKLRNPRGFILGVVDYQVLPLGLAEAYGRVVPPLECLLGLMLLTGIAPRAAATVAALLLFSFMIGILINVVRGRSPDCHCFGTGGKRKVGPRLLLEDGALLLAALSVFLLPGSWVGFESTPPNWPGAAVPVAHLIVGMLVGATALSASRAWRWRRQAAGALAGQPARARAMATTGERGAR